MTKPDKPYRHRSIGNHQLRPESLMMSYGYDGCGSGMANVSY